MSVHTSRWRRRRGGDNSYIWSGNIGTPGGAGGASGGAAWVWLNAKKLYNKSPQGSYFSIESTGWSAGGTAGTGGSGYTSGGNGADVYLRAYYKLDSASDWQYKNLLIVPGGCGGSGHAWNGNKTVDGGSIGTFTYNYSSSIFGSDCLFARWVVGKMGGFGSSGSNNTVGGTGENYVNTTNSLTPIWTTTFSLGISSSYGSATASSTYGGGGGASIAGYNYSGYGYGGSGGQSADSDKQAKAGGPAFCAILRNTYTHFSAPSPSLSTTTSHQIYNNNSVSAVLYYSTDSGNTWNTQTIASMNYITLTYTKGTYKGIFYVVPKSGQPGMVSALATG